MDIFTAAGFVLLLMLILLFKILIRQKELQQKLQHSKELCAFFATIGYRWKLRGFWVGDFRVVALEPRYYVNPTEPEIYKHGGTIGK